MFYSDVLFRVTEYLAGTTKNPLVVNSNQTVLSDLRIFSSDNNVTMNRQVAKYIEFSEVFQGTNLDQIA
jgi:hypothetical protein